MLVPATTKSCPPQKRAASTRSTATNTDGFVEASPSRSRCAFAVNLVLRDGEGRFLIKVSHQLKLAITELLRLI
jgi:hypothetical protein